MTASELAFLGLGLLLGAAAGAALSVVVGARPPRREIRVTVAHDALPRRSETLSQTAFVTLPGEPARGGPGDRRAVDRDRRDDGRSAPADPSPVGIPVMAGRPPGAGDDRGRDRTIVPSRPAELPALATATAILQAEPRLRAAAGATMDRILRGEHLAMVEALDRIAGTDGLARREWQVLIGGLVEALAEAAVDESVIDLPMGSAFWDSFTIEQARRVVGALASMGYRYDGRDGWVEGRSPAYRDLSQALADVGLEPRRMRAWPNSSEIAGLFRGARPAPEELIAAAGPDYRAEDVRELVGERAAGLEGLWLAWEAARPALFEEHPAAAVEEAALP